MWGRKRKRIERLENRMKELEDILCPERHRWEIVGHDYICMGGAIEVIDKYRCKTCHRIEFDFFPPTRLMYRGDEE